MSVNIWNTNINKYSLNKYFPKQNIPYTYILNPLDLSNFIFPSIIKPIICSGTSKNVKLITKFEELDEYIKQLDINEIYIVQQFIKAKYEIGVLYEKIPGYSEGNMVSIVLKKSNSKKWIPLKCGNIGNAETTICEDLTLKLSNSKFSQLIVKISNSIPNFYAGRYDIGFNSFEDLDNGIFKIYELNGVMGFDLRFNMVSHSITPEKFYYLARWFSIRCLIGLLNICYLKISPWYLIKKIPTILNNAYRCNDYEHLFQPSPA